MVSMNSAWELSAFRIDNDSRLFYTWRFGGHLFYRPHIFEITINGLSFPLRKEICMNEKCENNGQSED